MAVLILAVHEPKTGKTAKRPAFRLSRSFRLNRAVWGVIGIASVLMLARFSEAFVLLKSLVAGFSPSWVPLSMVVMHAVYGLTAWPVGRL